jgi:hypothetical protein
VSSESARRAIEEAAGYVRDTIRHFTDDERKRILEIARRELDSKLAVRDGSLGLPVGIGPRAAHNS